jgi:arginyl-tRNA synthetase
VITRQLRDAVGRAVAAEGFAQAADPGLRPTGIPGQYAASVALTLGANPRETAEILARALAQQQWIDTAEVTGPGYLTITVTSEALAAVAENITAAGPACAASAALTGVTVQAPTAVDPLAEASWEKARAALAAQLTASLAAAAGATVAMQQDMERTVAPSDRPMNPHVSAAVAYAGVDAVRFSLARAVPGRPVAIEPEIIARHVLGNPAYAVRYAHARAASGVRWTALSGRRLPADQGELVLLDALSWLPERVATAARRGRPDEFARYLEELARAAIAALIGAGDPGAAGAPGTGRLAMARAARTGLAAGLGLLGVGAPDRL